MSNVGESILSAVTEGLSIGKGEKKVIDAFLDKKKADGKKLSTDGTTLDGSWMGGSGIAKWEKGKIVMPDLGSKAADKVQKAIKKKAPKNWLAEAELDEKVAYHVSSHVEGKVDSAAYDVSMDVVEDMGLMAFGSDMTKAVDKQGKWRQRLENDLSKVMLKTIKGSLRSVKESQEVEEATKLTADQLKEIEGELLSNNTGVPVRFMKGGRNLDIVTGNFQKKGVNVVHQLVYWNMTKETAKKIAGWLGVKAVFSK